MRIIKPSHKILFMPDSREILTLIELAGRTCYKSENLMTEDSAKQFAAGIIKSGHHSVIEHVNITVRFVCDRGILAELTRHRLASYSVESTRYANYSKDKFGNELTVIKPLFWEEGSPEYEQWAAAMQDAERRYMTLLSLGAKAEQARSVLPNSLKTEIVMTCNLREWKHVFRMRCQKAAHPQIRELMLPLLKELHEKIPVIFDEEYETFSAQ